MKTLFLVDGAAGTGKSDLLRYMVGKRRPNATLIAKYTTKSGDTYPNSQEYGLPSISRRSSLVVEEMGQGLQSCTRNCLGQRKAAVMQDVTIHPSPTAILSAVLLGRRLSCDAASSCTGNGSAFAARGTGVPRGVKP